MDNILVKKNKSLNCRLAIKVLSIISLVCTALSCISDFYNSYDAYEIKFVGLIMLLLLIAPAVLFILYIFKFYNKLKATFLVPIIFGLLAFETFYDFSTGLRYMNPVVNLIGNFLCPAACFLALISALVSVIKGFNRKNVIIIAMSLCLLYKALHLVDVFIYWIDDWHYVGLFIHLMSIIGSSALYIAMLLFALKNIMPSVLTPSPEKEKARMEKLNPEQALKRLKNKLDLDMITEEEYQAQRAEIISKL